MKIWQNWFRFFFHVGLVFLAILFKVYHSLKNYAVKVSTKSLKLIKQSRWTWWKAHNNWKINVLTLIFLCFWNVHLIWQKLSELFSTKSLFCEWTSYTWKKSFWLQTCMQTRLKQRTIFSSCWWWIKWSLHELSHTLWGF